MFLHRNFRFRSLLLLLAFAAAMLPTSASATALNIGPVSMEGALSVNPGDRLAVGFDFTIPGSHPATTVTFEDARVTLPYKCATGPGGFVVVALGNPGAAIPLNNTGWFPSGDQSNPLVWQGSSTLGALCGPGAAISLKYAGAFGAEFDANVLTPTGAPVLDVHVRFHYARCNDATHCTASWSSTVSVTTSPAVDVCHNLAGSQSSAPDGMVVNAGGDCVTPYDACPNITGPQASVPDGMVVDSHRDCVTPYDACPNIAGPQAGMPDGMVIDSHGDCVTPFDACPNILGPQPSVPDGMVVNGSGECVTPYDACPNIAGAQSSVPSGATIDATGKCVAVEAAQAAPPVVIDVCPNLTGAQPTTPAGMTIDKDHRCITPPKEAPAIAAAAGGGPTCRVFVANQDSNSSIRIWSTCGQSILFWGDPHVRSVDGSQRHEFNIGYGHGRIELGGGARITWDTWHNASHAMLWMRLHRPGHRDQLIRTNDGRDVTRQLTSLTSVQLRAFIRGIYRYRGAWNQSLHRA